MTAPFDNKNALKPDSERASSFLYIRATKADKAGWVRAAMRAGKNLSEWATAVLNRAAGRNSK